MKIGVIGGGASGMIAAISAARMGAQVTILEGTDRIGHKILATGNGKCNFTNDFMNATCFRSNSIQDVSPFLNEFQTEDTLRFFASIHMLYHQKNGYYYPLSGQASTLLDALRFTIDKNSLICLETSQKAKCITYKENLGVIVTTEKKQFVFDKVIMACGSKAAPKTGSDGSGYALLRAINKDIKIEPIVPALVQLRCKEGYLKAVAGVRTEAIVSVDIDGEIVAQDRGELQLTDYGVSGIPVFQVSRFASYGCKNNCSVKVHINVMPQFDEIEFKNLMWQRKRDFSQSTLEVFINGLINKKICQLFCKLSGLSLATNVSDISDESFNALLQYFRDWELHVEKPNGFDMAQVCAGGLSMKEIDTHFSLKKCPNIYVVGELLDVDGICGGYNLQWAWTTGFLAGKYAAQE